MGQDDFGDHKRDITRCRDMRGGLNCGKSMRFVYTIFATRNAYDV